jgi:hypothetical protein
MSIVTGTNLATISINQQGALGIAPVTNPLPAAVLSLKSSFPASGAGADQFAFVHAKTYVFAASTPITLNLFTGALLDIVGNPIVFSAVRYFLYRIQSQIATFLIAAGGASTNPWNARLVGTSTELWYPSSANNDGFTIIQAPSVTGMPVSSGSCQFKLDPGTNAVGNVDIIIAGS